MNDFNIPIVEVRLKHMGQQILHAFTMQQNDLSEHIKKAMDDLMTDKHIQEEIDRLCYDCLKECIKEVFESQAVKRDLIKIMTEQVLARLNTTVPYPDHVQCPPVAPSGTGAPLPPPPDIVSQSDDDFWDSGIGKGPHAGLGRGSNAEG